MKTSIPQRKINFNIPEEFADKVEFELKKKGLTIAGLLKSLLCIWYKEEIRFQIQQKELTK